jgi:glycosyltransferase involved in cell wall biosynthesis
MEGIIISYGVLPHFLRQDYDVVICGGINSFTTLQVLTREGFGGDARCILWSESNLFDKPRRWALEAIKRYLVRRFDGWVAAGETSRDYLVHLGARKGEVYIAPDAVHTKFFNEESRAAQTKRATLRRQRGYPEHVLLYVGRLIDKKGILLLLEAFRRLDRSDVGLVLVGDGPRKEAYQEYSVEHSLSNVYFEGFQPVEKLPQYYALADVFVFPTLSDPWGLVINEAMSCRLPVISSHKAGAAADLVLDGVNGYTYAPSDLDRLVHLIQTLIQDEALRSEMGRNSWRIIQHYTPDRCAQGFVEAVLGTENDAGRWARMNREQRMREMGLDRC